ncbi:MAG: hypothetical protein ACKVUT_02765 [Gaiella sp.]
MKVAMSLPGGDDVALVVDQALFHSAVGVDVITVPRSVAEAAGAERLESLVKNGRVRVVPGGGGPAAMRHETLEAAAASGEPADWYIPCGAGEFFWPRGPGLPETLAPVPPRYTVVQALVRTFVTPAGESTDPGRSTVRWSLLTPTVAPDPVALALRPVYRTTGNAPGRAAPDVPLRAWYPIEVMRYPATASELPPAATSLGAAEIESGLRDGALVVDERLRDALQALRVDGAPQRLELPVPDIVDDASYAVECAAIHEVDLEALDRQIRALESRIAWLEQRFWPRIWRRALRTVGR